MSTRVELNTGNTVAKSNSNGLDLLLEKIYRDGGYDFRYYKQGTVVRRLRFWSAASARGEEPYSIAIMLAEFLGDRLKDFDTRVYATDINRQALKQAQAGAYSLKDLENLPKGNLKKYFTRTSQDYVVKAHIRKMIHFSYFDLTSSIKPPFTELDCIFCCNVLIYLQKQLQKRLLGMLYEVLATSGYLVLGEVETPTDNLSKKLTCLDAKAKIYKKRMSDGVEKEGNHKQCS